MHFFNSLWQLKNDKTWTNQQVLLMSRKEELNQLVTELEEDIDKFYEKGNKAAGTRARKKLQEIKKKSQEIRLEIQDMKNTGKV